MPVTSATIPSAQSTVFGRLFTQGTLYTAGMQLGNMAVVLPYICAHEGLTWVAAMLFPAYGVGSIAGNSFSPVILQRAGRMRHLLIAGITAAAAVLILCNAVVPWDGPAAGPVFLLTCAGGGVLVAVSTVAYSDMISSKLSAARRGELLLAQGAAGSVVATVVTLFVVPALAHGDAMAYRRDLLWLGAAGLAAAAIASLFVGPMGSASVSPRQPMRETYRQGFAIARSQPWFRRYVVACLLFAPVTLGTTFYALRTAHQSGSLHVLVILSSIGLVIGSPLWRRIYGVFGVRGMTLGSALLSVTAAMLSLAAESCGQWSHMWAYGTVFLLATVAGQAVFAAAISWISVVADESHRGTLIGFCSTVVAVETTALGGIFGWIAQNHSAIWPDAVVLLMAVAAALASLAAPASESRRAVVAAQPGRVFSTSSSVSLQAA